uniref:Secreted protein n=1 Tax=Knipowitschia caucasica TaxID=637954 RepID=A0AAV2J3P2_KNICA
MLMMVKMALALSCPEIKPETLINRSPAMLHATMLHATMLHAAMLHAVMLHATILHATMLHAAMLHFHHATRIVLT